MKDIHRVLKTIQVNSEKAQILTEDNIYVFKVDKRATKIEIKEAPKPNATKALTISLSSIPLFSKIK